MKAAVFRKRGLMEIEEVPIPEVGPGEALLKVKYCGICGSDLHYYDSDLTTPGGRMGHEFSAVIADLGPGVTDWKVGDRVIPALRQPCGRCHWCKIGQYNMCMGGPSISATTQEWQAYARGYAGFFGAYAEYVRVAAARLIRIPDEVTMQQAAMVEPLATSMGAVRRSGLVLGDTAIVLGAGPIGLMAMQCAKIAGAVRVLVSEGAPSRSALAAKLGAYKVFDPREVDVVQEVLRETEIGADVVFECAAVPASIEGSVRMVRRGGKVMMVGVRLDPVNLITLEWILKQVNVEATLGGNMALSMDLIKYGRIDVDSLVTDIVPLDKLQDAFQSLLRPTTQVKVLVEP